MNGESNPWNNSYAQGKGINRYPFSNVITYLSRVSRITEIRNVLELGFGTGPNIVIPVEYNWTYTGIELSKYAFQIAHQRYIEPRIVTSGGGGITLVNANLNEIDIEMYGEFDLIFERATLTHLDCTSLQRTLGQIYRSLRPGGIFLGLDWFSTSYFEINNGTQVPDFECTYNEFRSGQFESFGTTHFVDYPHIMELFKNFTPLAVRSNHANEFILNSGVPHDPSTWTLVMQK